MIDAQTLYQRVGFSFIEPYAESEIPSEYHPNWVFMELTLASKKMVLPVISNSWRSPRNFSLFTVFVSLSEMSPLDAKRYTDLAIAHSLPCTANKSSTA